MNLADTLERLVRFDTTSGNNDQIHKAYEWIRKQFKHLPVQFSVVRKDDFESLIVTSQPTKHPRILLAAHIDVVPAFDNSAFKPVIRQGKMYGRGAYDMKSAIACYMQIFKELGEDLQSYNIGILLTPDEEIGGFYGTKLVLENGWSADSVILPDIGTSWKLERSAKGVYHVKMIVHGKSAHGSRPWEGENALYTAIEAIKLLRTHFYDGSNLNETRKHEDTISFGKIVGGEATNKLIENLEVDIDIRFTFETGKKGVEKILSSIEKKFPQIKFKTILTADSFRVDTKNKYLNAFKKIAEAKIKRSIEFIDSYGSSDARFFSAAGIPTILMQSNGGGHHGPNEWCDLKDLEKFKDIIKSYVEKFGKA
jgi:succinyl-diaminopimelate desuccinylase